jgi:uncharacterized lipoprotein
MKAVWRLVLLVPLCVGLHGCHIARAVSKRACHDQQPYMQASTVPPLVIPPGLAVPDTSNALRLPALNEAGPPPRTKNQPCLDEPPPFKVAQPPRTPQA